jgi:hypothetical protein
MVLNYSPLLDESTVCVSFCEVMTELNTALGENGQKLILRNYACVWYLGQTYGNMFKENGIIISFHQCRHHILRESETKKRTVR